jgi:hypothetical protein
LSELKLSTGAFGTFEGLEAVALGILGKLALWRALEAIANSDPCLDGVDFAELAQRAEQQHSLAEKLRLQAARDAFVTPPGAIPNAIPLFANEHPLLRQPD